MWQPQFKHYHRWVSKMLWGFLKMISPGPCPSWEGCPASASCSCPASSLPWSPWASPSSSTSTSSSRGEFLLLSPRGTWHLLSLISRRSRVEFYQISSWAGGFRLQTDHTGRTLIPCWNVQSTCLIRPGHDENNDVGDDVNDGYDDFDFYNDITDASSMMIVLISLTRTVLVL